MTESIFRTLAILCLTASLGCTFALGPDGRWISVGVAEGSCVAGSVLDASVELGHCAPAEDD